jgi:hypothetical protein
VRRINLPGTASEGAEMKSLRIVLLSSLVLSLFSISAMAKEPADGCPPPTGWTDKDCSIAYTGFSFLDAITLNPRVFGLLHAQELIDEASSGTNDPACAPRMEKMTKKIHGNFFHKGCEKADIRDVQEIIDQANRDKVFCRPSSETGVGYDVYSEKRIREYVLEQLREKNPELCK